MYNQSIFLTSKSDLIDFRNLVYMQTSRSQETKAANQRGKCLKVHGLQQFHSHRHTQNSLGKPSIMGKRMLLLREMINDSQNIDIDTAMGSHSPAKSKIKF